MRLVLLIFGFKLSVGPLDASGCSNLPGTRHQACRVLPSRAISGTGQVLAVVISVSAAARPAAREGGRRAAHEVLRDLWVTDITEHATREGKIYCAVVLDVFSRRVVRWSIDGSQAAALVTNALSIAIGNPQAGPAVIHSDHGVPFTGLGCSSFGRQTGHQVRPLLFEHGVDVGVGGYALARQLTAAGVRCVVAAPSKLQRAPGDRVKTDARDAVHLARLLRMDQIVAVRVPGAEQEAARDLVRAREDVRGDLMRRRHRLSKLLLRQGIVWSGGQAWTGAHERWLRGQRFDRAGVQLAFESSSRRCC